MFVVDIGTWSRSSVIASSAIGTWQQSASALEPLCAYSRIDRRLTPNQPIGVIGTSMGGAAVLLADPPLKVDAMVLEQVYPTLAQALDDRMRLHAGRVGGWLAPLLAIAVLQYLAASRFPIV